MKIEGMALAGSTETISTKKRGDLQKTKLKVMDMGAEASGGDLYWIDFLGEAALSDEELAAILRQPVVIEVRFMRASAGLVGQSLGTVGRVGAARPSAWKVR